MASGIAHAEQAQMLEPQQGGRGELTFQSIHEVQRDIGAPHLQHGCHLDGNKQMQCILEICRQGHVLTALS